MPKSTHAVAKPGQTHQLCTKCWEEKPLSEFYWRKDEQTYRRDCKVCMRARIREYEALKLPHVRATARRGELRRRYGMTPEEWDLILKAQGGVCCLCGKPPRTERKMAVDHCHATQRLRGILCGYCNMSVAWVEATGFEKIKAYIEGSLPI